VRGPRLKSLLPATRAQIKPDSMFARGDYGGASASEWRSLRFDRARLSAESNELLHSASLGSPELCIIEKQRQRTAAAVERNRDKDRSFLRADESAEAQRSTNARVRAKESKESNFI